MRYYIIVFFIAGLHVNAQDKDGARKIATYPIDTAYSRNLHSLYLSAFDYIDSDPGKSLAILKEAQSMAFYSGDTLKIVKCGRTIGVLNLRLNKIVESITSFESVQQIANRLYFDEYVQIITGLGLGYVLKGNYSEGLKYNLESLRLNQKRGDDKSNLIPPMMNLALTYYKLGDSDKAIFYNNECLKLKNAIKVDDSFKPLKINIALCYAQKNDFTTAKKFVQEFISECNGECDARLTMQADFCLGVIYLRTLELQKSEHYFKQSYARAIELNDIRFQFDNINYLSQLYLAKGDVKSADIFLSKTELLIKNDSTFARELLSIYSRFIDISSKTKDFKRIAHYQQKYISVNREVFNSELAINLVKVEVSHLENQHQERITSQNQVLALQEEVIHRQQVLNISIGTIAGMLLLIAFLLIRSIRQKKRINYSLEQKVKQRTRQLQESYDEMLRSNQEGKLVAERTSLDIKSSVLTLKGLCSVAIRDLKDEQANEYITKINLTTDQIMEELKRFQNLTQLSALDGKQFLKQ